MAVSNQEYLGCEGGLPEDPGKCQEITGEQCRSVPWFVRLCRVFAPLIIIRPPMASIGGLFHQDEFKQAHVPSRKGLEIPYDGYSNGLFYKAYFSYMLY